MTRAGRRALVVALAVALAAAGCSIETAGAPSGYVTLYATFEDVHLQRGARMGPNHGETTSILSRTVVLLASWHPRIMVRCRALVARIAFFVDHEASAATRRVPP